MLRLKRNHEFLLELLTRDAFLDHRSGLGMEPRCSENLAPRWSPDDLRRGAQLVTRSTAAAVNLRPLGIRSVSVTLHRPPRSALPCPVASFRTRH